MDYSILNNIKNVFFDFDGVLAESVQVKTQAFYKLYLPYGKVIAEKAKQHHLNNGGVSRFEKFKLYHKEFLGLTITDAEVENLAQQFSDIVLKDVITSKEVMGTTEFLKHLHSKNIQCWVITGTPTNEIKEVLKGRQMDQYFVDAFGSPEKKTYWTEYIIEKHGLKRSETLFFGDALADYEAAEKSKIQFVLRETSDNKDLFTDFRGVKIKDFT